MLEKGQTTMPTQEERINALERTVTLLEKRFNDADIQSVNHNATMLLGLSYKQQADIREIKNTQSEHTTILNEHTLKLNNLETLLTQILDRLTKNEN
ncbi:MAG: hypothetical protein NVS2B12_14970 [Ktedonobacteraceae bacterium]